MLLYDKKLIDGSRTYEVVFCIERYNHHGNSNWDSENALVLHRCNFRLSKTIAKIQGILYPAAFYISYYPRSTRTHGRGFAVPCSSWASGLATFWWKVQMQPFSAASCKKKTAQLLLLSPKPKLKVSKKRQATQMADPIGHSRATRGFLFSFL